MPVEAFHTLSNYTVGGPSFPGTFSLAGMFQGAALCDRMGALLKDQIFTQWVHKETHIEDLSLHAFELVVQDNLLELHVNDQAHIFKGAVQPTSETTTTALLRSQLTEIVSAPAKIQNNHLIPIIETAQSMFDRRARSVDYSQAKETDGDAYHHMAKMHSDAQITPRKAIDASERIIRDLISSSYTPKDLPTSVREGIATYALPRDLTAEVVRLHKELTTAQEELKKVGAEKKEFFTKEKELTEKNQALTTALTSAKDSLTRAEADKKGLTQKLTAAEEKLNKAQANREALKSELVEAKKGHDAAKQDLTNIQAEVKRYKSEAADAQQKLEKTESARNQARNDYTQAQERLHNLEAKLRKAERDKETAQATCTELQTTVDDFKQIQLGQFPADFTEEIKRLQEKYEALLAEHKFLDKNHSKVLLQAKDLRLQLEGFADAKAQIQELETNLNAQSTILFASAQETGRLRKALAAADTLHEQLNAQLTNTEKLHKQSITRLAKAHQGQVDKLQDALAQKEDKIAHIEADYKDQLTKINTTLAAAHKEHADKIAKFEDVINAQEELLTTANQKYTQERRKLIQDYEARIQACNKEREDADRDYKNNILFAYETAQGILQGYVEKIKQQTKEIADLEKWKREMNGHVRKYQADIALQNEELAQLKLVKHRTALMDADLIKSQEAQNANLASLVKKLEEISALDKKKIKDLEQKMTELMSKLTATFDAGVATSNEYHEESFREHLRKLARAKGEKALAQKEVRGLKEQRITQQATLDKLRRKIALAEKEAAVAAARTTELEEQAAHDKVALQKLKDSLNEHTLTLSAVKTALNSQSVHVNDLEEKLTETQSIISKQQGKIGALCDKMSRLKLSLEAKDLEIQEILGSKCVEAEADQLEMQVLNEELEAQLKDAQTELEAAKSQIARQAELNRNLQKESDERQELNDHYFADLTHKTKTLKELKINHDKLVNKNLQLEESLASIAEDDLEILKNAHASTQKAKTQASDAEKRLNEALEKQRRLKAELAALQNAAINESYLLHKVREAQEHAEKTDANLQTLMRAVSAINTKFGHEVITQIAEQCQVSLNSKTPEQIA